MRHLPSSGWELSATCAGIVVFVICGAVAASVVHYCTVEKSRQTRERDRSFMGEA
jgi:hypothetical protein